MSETLVLDSVQDETPVVEPTCEDKIADVLAVKDDVISLLSSPKKKYQPRGAKTRKDLIGKIRELLAMNGHSEEEIRTMNLNRRRKNSLGQLLGEQLRIRMDKHVNDKLGIPDDQVGRDKYCVDMLVRFDITLCKALERGVEFLDFGYSLDGFASQFEKSPALQAELRGCFDEWLSDPTNSWVRDFAGPGTRLAMVHFYSALNCLRKRQKPKKEFPRDLSPPMKKALVEAAFRKNLMPYPIVKTPTGEVDNVPQTKVV